MNLRQRKYAICFGQLIGMYIRGTMPRRLGRIVDAGATTKNDPRRVNINWPELEAKMALRNLVEPEVEPFIPEPGRVLMVEDMEPSIFGFAGGITKGSGLYTVARKKDGEIIGTFTTEGEAQAVIDKAKAAKKATLVLL